MEFTEVLSYYEKLRENTPETERWRVNKIIDMLKSNEAEKRKRRVRPLRWPYSRC